MIDPYRMVFVNFISLILTLCGIFIYKYVFPKKKINLFYLLIIISVLPIISVLRKGNYESGDLIIHSVYLVDFYKNLQEGILNPQWAGGLCGSYGCPLYIFQYVMPYYISSFFHFIGFSFLDSTKLLLIFSYITSGIGIYLWMKEEFGEKSAFAASLLYLFAPYHLMDMHFRVSVGEVLSFTFIPFMFLFCKKIIETNKLHFLILGGLNFMLLLLSHSSTTIIIVPLSIVYSFFVWERKRKRKMLDFLYLTCSFILGLLLSSYYLIPALIEYKYTWYSLGLTIGDFKPFTEYIYSPVLFGFLFQGHQGELRLIVGYAHLFIILVSIILLFSKKFLHKEKVFLLFLLISFSLLFFMMQAISEPIWKRLPILETFCIPWRLLVPISLIISIIGGLVVRKINNTTFLVIFCLFTVFSTILNWGNRRMVPENNNAYPTAQGIVLYTEYFDPSDPIFKESFLKRKYRPDLYWNMPKSPIEILSGNANFIQLSRQETKHEYIISAETKVNIKENTFYFPGWTVKVNNKIYPINYKSSSKLGVITFSLPKGLYDVEIIFLDSTTRRISKLISIFSFFFVFSCIVFLIINAIVKVNKSKKIKHLSKLIT